MTKQKRRIQPSGLDVVSLFLADNAEFATLVEEVSIVEINASIHASLEQNIEPAHLIACMEIIALILRKTSNKACSGCPLQLSILKILEFSFDSRLHPSKTAILSVCFGLFRIFAFAGKECA